MVSPADTSEQNHQFVCLKCKQNSTDKQTMLVNFLNQETFCDVTLVCEEKLIFAHKVILAMCSSYFQNILTKFEKRDPIVIFKDIKHSVMIALIDFMYKGEIFLLQGQVVEILEAAQVLKINGLLEGDDYYISKCEQPTGTNTAVTVHVKEEDVCLNDCNMREQTASLKKKKLAEVRRKHDGNDSSADSTEELLKEAESIFRELNDVREKNKAPVIPNNKGPSLNKDCVQGTDKNFAPILLKDKSNFMSRQSQDLGEDCHEYDGTSSNNRNSTVVRSEDCHEEEKESNAMYNGKVNTTCTVHSPNPNVGSNDEQNESTTAIKKEQSVVESVVCVIVPEHCEKNTSDTYNNELLTGTNVNDTMLHIGKDFEESINVNIITNSRNETIRNIDDSVLHNGENKKPCDSNTDMSIHHSVDDSQENDIGVVNDTNASMVSEDKSIPINIKLSQVSTRSFKTYKNKSLKVKKKPQFDGQNADLNLSGEQSVNNKLPSGSSVLKIDSPQFDESCDTHMKNVQLRRSLRRKVSNCASRSMPESGREKVDPLYLKDNRSMSESEEGFKKKKKITPNIKKSLSKCESKQAYTSGEKKTTPNINQIISKPGNSKSAQPIKNKIENMKMVTSKLTPNKKKSKNERMKTSTESPNKTVWKKMRFNKGVIPMTEYLSKPGNSEQLFWKEAWSVRIIKAVSNKKLGKSNGATMLGVDFNVLNEQIALRKKNVTRPKQIKRRQKSKVVYESTDYEYDSDQDSDTLLIKYDRSKKNIKHTVDRNSQSTMQFSCSDMDDEDSDIWDNKRKPLPLVDKTNRASIEPIPLTCTLNLGPVPVLQSTASEYSDDDVSEEFSGASDEDVTR